MVNQIIFPISERRLSKDRQFRQFENGSVLREEKVWIQAALDEKIK